MQPIFPRFTFLFSALVVSFLAPYLTGRPPRNLAGGCQRCSPPGAAYIIHHPLSIINFFTPRPAAIRCLLHDALHKAAPGHLIESGQEARLSPAITAEDPPAGCSFGLHGPLAVIPPLRSVGGPILRTHSGGPGERDPAAPGPPIFVLQKGSDDGTESQRPTVTDRVAAAGDQRGPGLRLRPA